MPQIVVRNIDAEVKEKLRLRAQQLGRSLEEEVREILRDAVRNETQPPEPLGQRLRRLFAGIGVDADVPELRGQPARPADLS